MFYTTSQLEKKYILKAIQNALLYVCIYLLITQTLCYIEGQIT